MTPPFRLRPASDADANAIAELYFASYRLLTFLPRLHKLDSYRWFVANRMLKECAVIVAEDDTGIVAFLALQGEEIRQLYTRPDRIGRGVGTQLIENAKSSGLAAFELSCFQANARARRFYEARGFHAIRFTDGRDNEERTPDVRYRWERRAKDGTDPPAE
jgi:putative acetyltransferase